jgi:uncharacterized metal-binding protein YceD (DUF177 family)
MTPKPPLSRPVSINDVPNRGSHIRFHAGPAELEALAALLDVPKVERLEARFDVKPWGRTGLIVTGEVEADIFQICGVTLEPFPAHVHEQVETRFDAPSEPARDEVPGAEHEADLDAPDPLDNGTADLGALAAEYVALGMDPYPRSPQAAEPEAPVEEQPTGTHRPFAGLDGLFAGKKG